MASVVDICNLALTNIRANTINSLTESSAEAQACKARFQHSLDMVIGGFPWNFAMKVQALPLLGDEPKEFQYAYDYPNDCLRARYIVPDYNLSEDRTNYHHFNFTHGELQSLQHAEKRRIPFEISLMDGDSKRILTNQPDAFLMYTMKVTNPTGLPADFIEAFSWWLAAALAIPVTGADTGRVLRQEALSIYQQVLNTAKANNANERWNTSTIPESPTIAARR